MNDYAVTLLRKDLQEKIERIEDCGWWIRTIEAVLSDEEQLENESPESIESYKQRLRSFSEAKEEFQKEAQSLRTALKSLRL